MQNTKLLPLFTHSALGFCPSRVVFAAAPGEGIAIRAQDVINAQNDKKKVEEWTKEEWREMAEIISPAKIGNKAEMEKSLDADALKRLQASDLNIYDAALNKAKTRKEREAMKLKKTSKEKRAILAEQVSTASTPATESDLAPVAEPTAPKIEDRAGGREGVTIESEATGDSKKERKILQTDLFETGLTGKQDYSVKQTKGDKSLRDTVAAAEGLDEEGVRELFGNIPVDSMEIASPVSSPAPLSEHAPSTTSRSSLESPPASNEPDIRGTVFERQGILSAIDEKFGFMYEQISKSDLQTTPLVLLKKLHVALMENNSNNIISALQQIKPKFKPITGWNIPKEDPQPAAPEQQRENAELLKVHHALRSFLTQESIELGTTIVASAQRLKTANLPFANSIFNQGEYRNYEKQTLQKIRIQAMQLLGVNELTTAQETGLRSEVEKVYETMKKYEKDMNKLYALPVDQAMREPSVSFNVKYDYLLSKAQAGEIKEQQFYGNLEYISKDWIGRVGLVDISNLAKKDIGVNMAFGRLFEAAKQGAFIDLTGSTDRVHQALASYVTQGSDNKWRVKLNAQVLKILMEHTFTHSGRQEVIGTQHSVGAEVTYAVDNEFLKQVSVIAAQHIRGTEKGNEVSLIVDTPDVRKELVAQPYFGGAKSNEIKVNALFKLSDNTSLQAGVGIRQVKFYEIPSLPGETKTTPTANAKLTHLLDKNWSAWLAANLQDNAVGYGAGATRDGSSWKPSVEIAKDAASRAKTIMASASYYYDGKSQQPKLFNDRGGLSALSAQDVISPIPGFGNPEFNVTEVRHSETVSVVKTTNKAPVVPEVPEVPEVVEVVPTTPTVTDYPTSTSASTVNAKVAGKVGATILVKGPGDAAYANKGVLPASGESTINLNLPNNNATNSFSIKLQNTAGMSPDQVINIIRDTIALSMNATLPAGTLARINAINSISSPAITSGPSSVDIASVRAAAFQALAEGGFLAAPMSIDITNATYNPITRQIDFQYTLPNNGDLNGATIKGTSIANILNGTGDTSKGISLNTLFWQQDVE